MRERVQRYCRGIAVLASLMVGPLPVVGTPIGSLVISEVFYDRVGADNGFEWLELYNASPVPLALSGFSIGYGGSDYRAATLSLDGVIGSGRYFVLGGPESDSTNASPAFDLVVNFNPDLQNAGSTADGVALFDVVAAAITSTRRPIDAVIYGGVNTNCLIDVAGGVGSVLVADAPSGRGIERISADSWQITESPNPGQGQLVLHTAPEPATLFLISLGLVYFLVQASLVPARREQSHRFGRSFDRGVLLGTTLRRRPESSRRRMCPQSGR